MKLGRVVIAGVNVGSDLIKQGKVKTALKKIESVARRIMGDDIEFDVVYNANSVSPTSCDLMIVVGSDDQLTRDIIIKYRAFNGRGDARLLDLKSRYSLPEQIYGAFLAWKYKQEMVVSRHSFAA